MLATLQMMSEIYGGVEGYLKTHCSLCEDDIAIIRNNLISEEVPIFA